MRTGRVRVGIEFLAVSVFAFRLAAQEPAPTASVPDLAENGVGWSTQSYWQDPNILQRYSFRANVDDKVAGAASVEVHLEVAANRPQPLVELRFAPPQPVDLSQAEAFEVSLKLLGGNPLKPRDVFFCSPDFKKLAIASWPAGLVLTPGADWQRVVLDLTEVRILDKENPNGNGEYNRRDVAILCLNFLLQDGAVDQRLLIDGLRVCALPRSPVLREAMADGSYVFTTPAYRAVVGRNGYLQSLRAGATEASW